MRTLTLQLVSFIFKNQLNAQLKYKRGEQGNIDVRQIPQRTEQENINIFLY